MKYQNIVILLSAASFATAASEDIAGNSQDAGSNLTQGTILALVSTSIEANIGRKHPSTSSCEEPPPPSSSCEEPPPTSSCEEPPPTSSCEEPPPSSSSCEEPPPTSSCEEPPPSSSYEEPPPTSSCEEPPPTSSCEETPPTNSQPSATSLHPLKSIEKTTEKPTEIPTEIPTKSPPESTKTIKAVHQKPTDTNNAPSEPTTMVTSAPLHTTPSAVARPPAIETFQAAALRGDPSSAAILSAILAVLLSVI